MVAHGVELVIWIGAGFAAGAGTVWLRQKGGWIAIILLWTSAVLLVAATSFQARQLAQSLPAGSLRGCSCFMGLGYPSIETKDNVTLALRERFCGISLLKVAAAIAARRAGSVCDSSNRPSSSPCHVGTALEGGAGILDGSRAQVALMRPTPSTRA